MISGLLTKSEFKMADIGQVFFFFFFVSVQKEKKERGKYTAILSEQVWLIKDFL